MSHHDGHYKCDRAAELFLKKVPTDAIAARLGLSKREVSKVIKTGLARREKRDAEAVNAGED